MLRTIDAKDLNLSRRAPVDPAAQKIASAVVDDVRNSGESALRRYAECFSEIEPGGKLLYTREELAASLSAIDEGDRALLERVAARIEAFALAQRESIREFDCDFPGGSVGQIVSPVERAGCYAPGGRFPLPSSVLMTAVTARAAGVAEVWIASPKPTPVTLAAAAVAGVDGLLAAGGAQAIAALAYGAGGVPACDVIAGPGNKYVTAAKKIVSGSVGIDMLAGPSELVVLADGDADPAIVAADLLAQAEHDPEAIPILISTEASLIGRVNAELERQMEGLPTADTAREALANGFAALASDVSEAIRICDAIAPEHLELQIGDADGISDRLKHYGALFVGAGAAEVLGDYGVGPNHTLPTGGTARYTGGLSVMNFLRVRTRMRMDDAKQAGRMIDDATRMGELEGLVAHARSAAMRRGR